MIHKTQHCCGSAGLLLAGLLLLSACADTYAPEHSKDTARNDSAYIACEEPRPEMCTQQHEPVCASRDTGIRCVTTPCDSTEWKTYSNACMACADHDVYGYKNNACDEQENHSPKPG